MTSSTLLPGFEPVVAQELLFATAFKEQEQKQLVEAALRTPAADISKAAGEMERHSPLFFGIGALEQQVLFSSPPCENIARETIQKHKAKPKPKQELADLRRQLADAEGTAEETGSLIVEIDTHLAAHFANRIDDNWWQGACHNGFIDYEFWTTRSDGRYPIAVIHALRHERAELHRGLRAATLLIAELTPKVSALAQLIEPSTQPKPSTEPAMTEPVDEPVTEPIEAATPATEQEAPTHDDHAIDQWANEGGR